jgi:hypothetical protein
VLAGGPVKAELAALVEVAGGLVVNPPGTPSVRVPPVGGGPDRVVLHHGAGLAKHMLAGYWRGLGRPVVYVVPRDSRGHKANGEAARLVGMYRLSCVAEFGRYLKES